jgi:hypothetical protein
MKTYFSSTILLSVFASISKDSNPFFKPNDLDIIIDGHIETDRDLVFSAKRNIIIKETASIEASGSANIMFEAGTTGNGIGNVIFEGNATQIFLDEGMLSVYYNPGPPNTTKYANKFTNQYLNPTFFNVDKQEQVEAYMWVNNIYDLQNIRTWLGGSYALSRDIEPDRAISRINSGKGFQPIHLPAKHSSFYGRFDGRNHAIRNLEIKCGETDARLPAFGGCGIFGRISKEASIKNLVIDSCSVEGDHYVGLLFGTATDTVVIKNITILNSSAKGIALVGRLGGTTNSARSFEYANITYENTTVEAIEYQGELLGAFKDGLNSAQADCIAKGLPRDTVINLTNFWHASALNELTSHGLTANMLLTRNESGHAFDDHHAWALMNLVKERHFTVTQALEEIDGLSSAQAGGIKEGLTRDDVINLTNLWHVNALTKLASHGLSADMLLMRNENGHEFNANHAYALMNLVEKRHFTVTQALEEIDGLNSDQACGIYEEGLTRNDVIDSNPGLRA